MIIPELFLRVIRQWPKKNSMTNDRVKHHKYLEG